MGTLHIFMQTLTQKHACEYDYEHTNVLFIKTTRKLITQLLIQSFSNQVHKNVYFVT